MPLGTGAGAAAPASSPALAACTRICSWIQECPLVSVRIERRLLPGRRGGQQGCIKLQLEGSPERGGDSLSPQFEAHSAGDKLSPPRKAELDAALGGQALALEGWEMGVNKGRSRVVKGLRLVVVPRPEGNSYRSPAVFKGSQYLELTNACGPPSAGSLGGLICLSFRASEWPSAKTTTPLCW